MPILSLKTELTKSDLLRGVEQLEMVDLEEFIRETIKIRANKKVTVTSVKETELLLVIQHNFTKSEQRRFDNLIAKRKKEIITDEELEELKELSAYSEEIGVERVKALYQLAKIRKTSVRTLMKELKVKPVNYG